MSFTPRDDSHRPEQAGGAGFDGAACLTGDAPRSTMYRTVAEIPTGLGPEGATVDAERRRAYVTASRSQSLTVVDLDRLTATGEIPVGGEPTDVALDARAQRMFVCDWVRGGRLGCGDRR